MAIVVFPVEGGTYSDTWGAPRPGGRTHKGVDIFAPHGTPIKAVASGELTFKETETGGLGARLKAADGERYIFSHLSRYAGAPRSVEAGDVIGYVGNTGNASATDPHLHFGALDDKGDFYDPFAALKSAEKGQSVDTTSEKRESAAGSLAVGVLFAWLAIRLTVLYRGKKR